ncbi:uncharacterized protein LOC134681936 [Mytilus trossulus]|uniref:uncharacterized protein LOC134681936 n=1 Tax=Mytilus trossulus TaxID=6551 RepID=UPI003004CE72
MSSLLQPLSVFVNLFLFLTIVSQILGCIPTYLHSQSKFCHSDFVFEARVIKWTNTDSENATYEERLENMENRTYKVDILHTYKNGSSLLKNFSGSIRCFGVCEHFNQSMEPSKKYLIYANKDNSTDVPVLYEYTEPLSEDVRHITHFYDCSCQIREPLTVDSTNMTSISFNSSKECMPLYKPCLIYRGYCGRDQNGSCSWNTFGTCDMQSNDSDINSGAINDYGSYMVVLYLSFFKYFILLI